MARLVCQQTWVSQDFSGFCVSIYVDTLSYSSHILFLLTLLFYHGVVGLTGYEQIFASLPSARTPSLKAQILDVHTTTLGAPSSGHQLSCCRQSSTSQASKPTPRTTPRTLVSISSSGHQSSCSGVQYITLRHSHYSRF